MAPEQVDLSGEYFIKVTDSNNNKGSAIIALNPTVVNPPACVLCDDNFTMKFPCLRVGNDYYTFNLLFHQVPEEPFRLFWIVDWNSFAPVTAEGVLPNCMELMEDLGIKVGCTKYGDGKYSFDFRYFPNQADVNNVFFEMDLSTFH